MLAPLRDYLSPKDPMSSSLLRAVKERYFSRMSVYLDPNDPGFAKTQWITSEDINVEHLLDVFTTIDAGSTMSGKPVKIYGAPLLAQKAAHDSGAKNRRAPRRS
jgi:hypothetical protein